MQRLLTSGSVRTTQLVFGILAVSAIAFGSLFISEAHAAITTLTVTSPNGGEDWRGMHDITWSSTGGVPSDLIDIVIIDETLGFSHEITTDIAYDASPFFWDTATENDGVNYKIRILKAGTGTVYDTSDAVFEIDNTAPVLAEVTPVPTPDDDSTPPYTFSTDEAGTISYGGGCSSATTVAVVGSNTVTFAALADGLYDACTVTVTDDADAGGNASIPLSVSDFRVDTVAPDVDAGADVVTNVLVAQDATATDPDPASGISSYLWTNETPGVGIITFASDDEEDTTISADTDGTYTIRLTVTDNAGNSDFDEITFVWDTTAPAAFMVGTVVTTGAPIVAGWWNSTNTGVDVDVPVAADASLTGGTIQLQAEADGVFENVGDPYTILVGDLSTDVTISLTSAQLEAIVGFGDGDNITFTAIITDAATNATTGTQSADDLDVDQEAPVVYAGTDKEVNAVVSQDAITSDGGSGLNTFAWTQTVGGGVIAFSNQFDTTPDVDSDTDITATTEEVHTLRLTVTDIAGNSNFDEIQFAWDITNPVLAIFTAVKNPTNDQTPDFTFSADSVKQLAGSVGEIISYTGSCKATPTVPIDGSNTITLEAAAGGDLADATYTDCDLTVTDAAGNTSATLEINDFEVDTIAAMIASVTTEDLDENGSIDTATLVFTDEIDDSTVVLTDFAIEGINPTATSTGATPNDSTIVLTFGTQVAGTEAKTLEYGSVATDLAGNTIMPFSEVSVDAAGPVMLSARTITTTRIDTTWSENIDGATVNDLGTEFTVVGFAVSAADDNSDNVVELTVATMPTDATPDVTFTNTGTFTDLNGVEAVTPITVTAVDGVAPVLTAVSISSSNAKDGTAWAKEGDTVTVSFTASEELDSTLFTPAVTIDGNPADAITNTIGDDWTATRVMQAGDTEGAVTFTIDFEDVAVPTHNVGTQVTAITAGTNITYDETMPEVDAGPNQEVNAMVSQDAITDDPGAFASGIDTWLWEKITGPGAIAFGSATVEDTTIAADTDGVYIIRLTVEDEAGNVNDDEMQLIWDTLAPRLEYIVPAHGSTGIDTDAGTLEAYFREMNHGVNPENLTLEDDAFVFLEDTAGNDVQIGVAVQGGDGTSNILEIDYSALTAGTTYCLTLMAGAVSDAAGNVTTLDIEGRCFTAAADTTVPVINSLSASGITASGATITAETNETASCSIAVTDQAYGTMTAFDATSGVTSHTTTLSGLSEQTQYTYYVRCADTAGNEMTTSGTVNFLTAVLDTSAPDAPVITTAETIVNSDFYTIAGTVDMDDDEAGTLTITVYNGASAAGSLNVPDGQTAWAIIVPLTQNATSTFSAKAVDISGNESAASNSVDIGDDNLLNVDVTAPDAPAFITTDATVDADTYALSGTLADDGDIRTLFIHGGSIDATVQLPAGETAWTVTVSLEQDSANSFTAQAADEAGNMSAETVPVVITETPEDGTAPTVSVSASGITTSGADIDVSVDETAVCRIGPADVAFDSLPTELSAGTPDTDHEYLPSGLADGTLYNYYVRCEDDAGNISNSAHVSFTTLTEEDEDGPDAPFLTTADAITDADTYTIAGTVADDGGARAVALYNGATLAGTTIVAAGQTAWALFVPLTQEADNVFTAIATDEAGNVSDTSGDVTITEATATGDVDAPEPPEITTSDDMVDVDTYAIEGTATNDGGTRTITVYRNGTVVGSVSLPAGDTDWSFVSSLLQNEENDFIAYSTDVAGNTSDASNTVTIEEEDADDTAPEVLSTDPENEDGDVSVGVSPSVTFDEALDPTTVSSDTVMLIDGDDNQVEATVSLVEGGTRAVIDPANPLEYDADYYIVITEDIADLAGNPFGSDGEYELAEFTTEEEPDGLLAVTGIDAVDTFASDTDDFADGWSWTFRITVPTAETTFAMKFSDFISGANTIFAANNIRYFTTQASANADEASAVTIVGADTYPASITLDSDLDASTAGRQIEVTVQAKVPAGSAGGSYSTSYGVATS